LDADNQITDLSQNNNKERKTMTINKNANGTLTTLEIIGRLDTTTAPELEAAIDGCLNDTQALVLDFHGLEYISSAGLRVLLKAQKSMAKKGSMKVLNVNETIMEVFDITGFSDILTIEN
jgi:anti-sigma B factor antagonist